MIIWLLIVIAVLLFVEREPLPVDNVSTEKPTVVYEPVLIPVEIEPENTAYYKEIHLTEEERLLLGKKIYAEAGNQTDTGKRAVVEVIFNRILDGRFPDTLTEVVNVPGQFTDASWVSEEKAKEQYPIIDTVLREQDPILREDVVYSATYKANGAFDEQIGAHFFCY